MDYKSKNNALYICVTAMFCALLVGGKQALSLLPNVEVVTLLVAVCSFVWGLRVSLPAVLVFVLCQMAIYGVNTWIVYYPIHWGLLAVVFWLISKIKTNKVVTVVIATVVAVVWTAFFGVLTTAVDTAIGFVGGQGFYWDFANFGKRFISMYLAGISFYVTHVLSNLGLFAVAFLPLVLLNQKAKVRLFGEIQQKPVDNDNQNTTVADSQSDKK